MNSSKIGSKNKVRSLEVRRDRFFDLRNLFGDHRVWLHFHFKNILDVFKRKLLIYRQRWPQKLRWVWPRLCLFWKCSAHICFCDWKVFIIMSCRWLTLVTPSSQADLYWVVWENKTAHRAYHLAWSLSREKVKVKSSQQPASRAEVNVVIILEIIEMVGQKSYSRFALSYCSQ